MTYLEAEQWASSHGLAIDLSVHRDIKTSAAPFDIEAAFVALVEELRRHVEGETAVACAACPDREKRIDSLAAENGRLRIELAAARLAASMQSGEQESGTITTNARVVRRHCVPVGEGQVVVEVPGRRP